MTWSERRWQIRPRQETDLLKHLLRSRGVAKEAEAAFLSPNFSRDVHDPFLFSQMKTAVARLEQARKHGETVGIFGDYDADGIPATVLLKLGLAHFGVNTVWYIPNRTDGYGLSAAGIEALKSEGASLIVTVDCGITGRAMVEAATFQGIDVIVTDHHEPQAELLPEQAVALINPKHDLGYPFSGLSGTAVAWKLLQALSIATGAPTEKELKWLLDLVAIATVADMVPLSDESRVLARFGLQVLQRGRRLGLAAICEQAGLKPAGLTFVQISMVLAPWLNAASRMLQPSVAVELLLSQKPHEARLLASQLGQANSARRTVIDRLWPAVEAQLANQMDAAVLVVADGSWPAGVVGLIASRLSRQYQKMAVALTKEGELWRGSARGVDGHPVLPVLTGAALQLHSFGGHQQAAGLAIAAEKFEQAVVALCEQAAVAPTITLPELAIDALLELSEASGRTLQLLRQLQPFGVGNAVPLFCLKNLQAERIRLVGKQKNHLQLMVSGLRAVSWDTAVPDWLRPGTALDVAFQLEPDDYMGEGRVQLVIQDGRPAEAS